MLLAATCPLCQRRAGAPCRPCLESLRPAPALPPPPGVDVVWALLSYEGPGRELVARLKYRNRRAALPGLARAAAALVDRPVDVVTWAPTTPARRRSRGFDQAELLARAVAVSLDRPCRRLLARRPGPPVTTLDRTSRLRAVAFASASAPARVLVVDDVVTTGATSAAAARALRTAGARWVGLLAISRTPRPATSQVRRGP